VVEVGKRPIRDDCDKRHPHANYREEASRGGKYAFRRGVSNFPAAEPLGWLLEVELPRNFSREIFRS
jgi:hypothetical protein